MNIVNKVTWKCLYQNKKRTIVTMIGVIICVAMLSAISVIGTSFQDVMVRSAIQTNGTYEFKLLGLPQNKVEQLMKDDTLNQSLRRSYVGEVSLRDAGYDISNGFRASLDIDAIDFDHPELIAIKLKEGSFPQKENEIVLSEQMMEHENFQHQVGDRIDLAITGRTTTSSPENPGQYETVPTDLGVHTYTITGIVSCESLNAKYSSYIGFTKYDATPYKGTLTDVSFTLNEIDDIFQLGEYFSETYTPSDMFTNTLLLNYRGVDTMGILSSYSVIVVFLIIIILIGGISLIYNAFSISLSERSRYLGMLSSVGATKQQKRNSVFFEAFVIGIVSIPIGLLAGIVGMGITFELLNPYILGMFDVANIKLETVVDARQMLFVIAFSVLILLISAWIPARKASRITAISAIRQSQDFKIRAKDVKTSRLTRKIFGVEAELGLKNMKRNHSRYLSTLSSLITCIVLFMSAQFFSTTMKQSVDMMQNSANADILINFYRMEESKLTSDTEFINQLRTFPGVDSSSLYGTLDSVLLSDGAKVTKETSEFLENQYKKFSEEELSYMTVQTIPSVKVQGLSNEDFQEYCEQVGVDAKRMDQTQPTAIVVNQRTVIEYEENSRVYRDLTLLDLNDTSTLSINNTYYDEALQKSMNNPTVEIQIAKVTDKVPSVNINNSSGAEVLVVMNLDHMYRLRDLIQAQNKDTTRIERVNYSLQINTKQAETVGVELEQIVIASEDYAGALYNNELQRLKSEQRNVFIETMLYGFVTLILLICTANIVNSISTSVNVRKREFAMIKSIGITKRKFNRMICFETLFYGMKACLYGIPLGLLISLLMYRSIRSSFIFAFVYQWKVYLMMIAGVFIMLSLTMAYAIHKIRKDNIVETIRSESI